MIHSIYPNALCQSAVQMPLIFTAEHFRLRYQNTFSVQQKPGRFAKGSPFEERLSPAGERCRNSDRVGNVASRSDDGEGEAVFIFTLFIIKKSAVLSIEMGTL